MNKTPEAIRNEALRKVMHTVGITNNDVNRYIADAVIEKMLRDEKLENDTQSPEEE